MRNLKRFGDLVFTSQKHNFCCLYVNRDALNETVAKIKEQNYVREVREGLMSTLAADFGAAFPETNEEIAEEMKKIAQ